MKKVTIYRIVMICLLLAMMVVIFFFSSQDGTTSMTVSGKLTERLLNAIHSPMESMTMEDQHAAIVTLNFLIRKAAHFTEFAILGALASLLMHSYWEKHAGLTGWLFATFYAATDELHQFLGGARSGMWEDVVLDSVGALVGAALAALFYRKVMDGYFAKAKKE